MTNKGVHRRKLPDVSRQAHERENRDRQVRKPRSHRMGVQLPSCIHTEMSATKALRRTAPVSWRGISKVSATEGKSHRRRASDAGSRAHDELDSTEVRCIAGGRIHQGQERNTSGKGVWGTEAELRGAALKGEKIFCIHRRARRRRDPGLRSTPVRRGQATGPIVFMALNRRGIGGPKMSGPCQRPLFVALSGSQFTAPVSFRNINHQFCRTLLKMSIHLGERNLPCAE